MKAILALVDFSNVTPQVLKVATELAQAHSARLIVLHAAQPEAYVTATEVGPIVARDSLADALHADHHKMRDIEQDLKAKGMNATAMLVHGPAVDKAIEQARKADAAYIVLGSHRHGSLYHLLLGNTATGVLRQAPCPVVVVPAPEKP